MRIPLVSIFLPDVTQHIHSLRASGVISFHNLSAMGVEIRAFRRSGGNLCTTPPAISFLFMWVLIGFRDRRAWIKYSERGRNQDGLAKEFFGICPIF